MKLTTQPNIVGFIIKKKVSEHTAAPAYIMNMWGGGGGGGGGGEGLVPPEH